MKTLEQCRKDWEGKSRVVGHYNFPHQHMRVSIVHGQFCTEGDRYMLIRYFAIGANLSGEGGDWQASVDLPIATATEVFDRLAYLVGGVKEGGNEDA